MEGTEAGTQVSSLKQGPWRKAASWLDPSHVQLYFLCSPGLPIYRWRNVHIYYQSKECPVVTRTDQPDEGNSSVEGPST